MTTPPPPEQQSPTNCTTSTAKMPQAHSEAKKGEHGVHAVASGRILQARKLAVTAQAEEELASGQISDATSEATQHHADQEALLDATVGILTPLQAKPTSMQAENAAPAVAMRSGAMPLGASLLPAVSDLVIDFAVDSPTCLPREKADSKTCVASIPCASS
eukprot:scaffold114_cov361-Pinguiococcus_pyrenoidosus.AAC.41